MPGRPSPSHAHAGHAFSTSPAPPHPDSLLGGVTASSHHSAGSPHAAEAAQVRGSRDRHRGDGEVLGRAKGSGGR